MVHRLLSAASLSVRRVSRVVSLTISVVGGGGGCSGVYRNGGLTALFFRPDAQAELSFRTTVLRLNNSMLNFSRTDSASTSGNRAIKSAAEIVSYCTSVVTVHRCVRNTPGITTSGTDVPIVGTNSNNRDRPARAVASLLAICERGNELSGLAVNLYNSLGFKEAIRDLIGTVYECDGVEFILVTPGRLTVPSCVGASCLSGGNVRCVRASGVRSIVPRLSILCVAHIRHRHFFSRSRCLGRGSTFVLSLRGLGGTGSSLAVVRPLPEMGRVTARISSSPHTGCFRRILGNGCVHVTLVVALLG